MRLKLVLFVALALVGAAMITSQVGAQSPNTTNRNDPMFCNGSIGWTFDGQPLDENAAPCGGSPDGLVVQVTKPWSPGNFSSVIQNMVWRAAVKFLKGNGFVNGSLWVIKPQNAATAVPATTGSNVTIPAGFCENKVGMPFGPGNLLPSSAPCGTGMYVLVDPFSDTVVKGPTNKFPDWTSLLNEAAKWKGGSVWFEPASGAPAAQATLVDVNQLVNWPDWCGEVSPFVFSAGGVLNVGSMQNLRPPCPITQIAVVEPWRPDCEAPRQDLNKNCNQGHAFLFSSINEAATWLSQNNWTEGSVWNRPGRTGGGGQNVCLKDIVKPGTTTVAVVIGSSDPCLNPAPAAMATQIATVQPTYTPYPTNTAYPTYTPMPPTATSMPSAATATPTSGGGGAGPTGPNFSGLGEWLAANWWWLLLLLIVIIVLIILVRDRNAHAGQWYWQRTPPAPLSVTTVTVLPNGHAGAAYAPPVLTVAGGTPPYTWALQPGAPAWVTLTPAGQLGGTPPAAAPAVTFTVRVTDSAGVHADKDLQITVF